MSKEMTLSTLLSPWLDLAADDAAQTIVSGLELDSRKVTPGQTFVAIRGHALDGRRFIPAAIEKGANAVIAEACPDHPHASVEYYAHVAVIYVEQLSLHLSELAGRLYPLQDNRLIGVTGTNGKTTISQLIAQWLELTGHKAAVMGTTGNGFLADLQPAVNTTGNAIEIQHTLYSLQQQGAEYTALEVSSHGLVQGRVRALPFSVGVFSNLSRDHLDYHGTMHDYAEAKFMLFGDHHCHHAVINSDDPVGANWLERLDNAVAVSLQPSQHPRAVWAKRVHYSEAGISVEFDGLFGQGEMTAPLIGEFNASNVLLAMTTLLMLGVDKQRLLETASELKPVLGRMELFTAPGKAKVVVDYAHTPDALEKALMALRVHCQGKLWAIFGCGGDRDTGKRPMMAKIAEQLADYQVLTDDNPRSESPQTIVDDMLAGMQHPKRAVVEHDRFAALEHALRHSGDQDIILLAGKGHEDYQVVGDQTIHYSDRESAVKLLEQAL
ncbi:UDP-N-acetylmuramoyl-L-alanyl-D-glutamate--2,6-diaminopimelate ligase [Vibrio sp. JPW-9-11-11]|uniref:UDP-N-acetylmuramoyl-L-alanyl-D-glutamate--2, 6-diaminopimelate ligase n=1 Tax=Vibrio sp. JPW-9-11-11 TaxID=1416532 RepID=UPI001592D406|nr:UDP-N-acetylmuramoyl-L-alanyl-D-glutamate--2,6-diaminopimelate ligase [Vibrio sp. JPW-9-11-11]NVD07409.1 UDP-N-acetylmuramoyl-L-alanyl-D-glutamate--2,6-diaminopimelate ligase [Vibrio sp. JPW-9-11-11]